MKEATPMRQKGAHIINMPSAVETIIGLILRLVNEKNRSRVNKFDYLLHNT